MINNVVIFYATTIERIHIRTISVQKHNNLVSD